MKLAIDNEVCWQRIEGQVYITKAGSFLLLNSTASMVWLGIYRAKDVEEIASYLGEQYGIKQTDVLKDVMQIIEQLVGLGILTYGKPEFNQ